MAIRWWRNLTGNFKHNDTGNWSTTEGGAGGASVPTSADDVYCSNAASAATILVQSNWSIKSLSGYVGTTGGTNSWQGDFVVGGYAVTVTNNFELDGVGANPAILGMNTPGSTLSCGELRMGTLSSLYTNADCQITASAGFYMFAGMTFQGGSQTLGRLVLSGSGVYSNTASWWPTDITVNAGVTMTWVDNSVMGWTNTNNLTINGTLALGAFNVNMLTSSSGLLTIGSNADVTGSGIWYLRGSVYSIAKTSAFSFAGTVDCNHWNTGGQQAPVADFSNANYQLSSDFPNPGRTLTFMSGTLKCKSLTLNTSGAGDDLTADASVNNPSFEVKNSVDFTLGVSRAVWTKGTGTIKFMPSGAGPYYINTNAQAVEDIICANTGSPRTVPANFTTDSVSGTAGTLQSNSAGVQRTITVSLTGTASGVTFKDIKVTNGVAPWYTKFVNAKGGTNLGNNLGIAFVDIRISGNKGWQP